jgi:hypothetical protein
MYTHNYNRLSHLPGIRIFRTVHGFQNNVLGDFYGNFKLIFSEKGHTLIAKRLG